MIEAPLQRRPRCERCRRPVVDCLCRWITPVANEVPVLVLQHPMEVPQAKGSASLLALSLARCRVEVGERFESTLLSGVSGDAMLLYPAGPDDVTAPVPTALTPTQRTLVVIDATWRKSRRMLFEHPWLADLPRLALSDPPASRYAAIRRAEQPTQRSTLEATCLALQQLEQNAARYVPLLTAFEGFVAQRQRWTPCRRL